MDLQPWADHDLAAIHALIRVCEDADGSQFATSLAELEHRAAEPYFDLAGDAVVAVDGDDLVGWASVWHEPSGVRLERAHLSGSVHPGHRGVGIGSLLVAWQVERGSALVGGYDHDLPRYLRTFERSELTDAHALFEAQGFRPVRWFEELLRDVSPVAAPEPEGIDIVAWDRALDGALLAVKNEAFDDHWGSTPSDEASWMAWLTDPDVRLDLSWVALDNGRVVGYALNAHYPQDEAVNGRRDGWIDSLGVLAEARGRGIASALIARSVAGFADAGFTHAMLGVDSENPSGAAHLYRRLGFAPLIHAVTHEREIRVNG